MMSGIRSNLINRDIIKNSKISSSPNAPALFFSPGGVSPSTTFAKRTYNDLEEGCDDNDDDCMERIVDQSQHCVTHSVGGSQQILHVDCELAKKDGRLFPEYLLYCEGHPKPVCRGVLHLVRFTRSQSSLPPFLQQSKPSLFIRVSPVVI